MYNVLLLRSFIVVAILLTAAPSSAADSKWRADAVTKLPVSGEIYLGMFNQGERDGFMRLGWVKHENHISIYDRSMLPSAEIYETQETIISARDLSPEHVKVRFHIGSTIHYMDVSFSGGVGKGERRTIKPSFDDQVTLVDIEELPNGSTLRISSFVLPLVLSQKEGDSISYTWYAPLGNKVEVVSLTARDGGEIDTPAGKFDTVIFELRGGFPENDIYVTRGEEPRIVRIDVHGQPFQFLAVPASKKK